MQEGGRVRVRGVMAGCAELIISHLTVADAGIYQCRSANRVGADLRTASVDVGCQSL